MCFTPSPPPVPSPTYLVANKRFPSSRSELRSQQTSPRERSIAETASSKRRYSATHHLEEEVEGRREERHDQQVDVGVADQPPQVVHVRVLEPEALLLLLQGELHALQCWSGKRTRATNGGDGKGGGGGDNGGDGHIVGGVRAKLAGRAFGVPARRSPKRGARLARSSLLHAADVIYCCMVLFFFAVWGENTHKTRPNPTLKAT